MTAWLRRSWPVLVVATGCGLYLSQSGASTATKVIVGLVCMGGVLLWFTIRNLRLHTTVNRLAAFGLPEAMLEVVEAELATSSSAQVQVPFSIYKATALSLQGKWAEALELLERVPPSGIVGKPGRTWRFLHANQLLTCLGFAGRVDDAEAALKDEIEPFAAAVPSAATQVMVDEARAKLAFFQGRDEDSRAGFTSLLEDTRIAPSSRALYHYFLARIAERTEPGADPGTSPESADEHDARAAELAPETFMGSA